MSLRIGIVIINVTVMFAVIFLKANLALSISSGLYFPPKIRGQILNLELNITFQD